MRSLGSTGTVAAGVPAGPEVAVAPSSSSPASPATSAAGSRGSSPADPAIDRVIGVDVIPPPHDIGDAEFVRADIRNPVIAKVIAQAEVDTVVHMNVIATPLSRRRPGRR